MIGIYKITNKINKKCYIGQSIDIEKRWKAHITRSAKHNTEKYSEKIYQAIRKYGISNFIFEVIEECSIDELDEKELKWIKYYDSYNNGYNMILKGNVQNCINANKKRMIPVIAYSLEGEFIKEYQSLSEASRDTNVNIFIIRQCLNKKMNRGGVYQWREKKNNYIPKTIAPYQRKIDPRAVSIEQYDLDNNLLNKFNSILEASNKTGVSRRSIMRVCNGEQKSSKGFIWKKGGK